MTGEPYCHKCRLCVEINDFEESLFQERYPGLIEENCFLETANLQVMIPVGPLGTGHLLIVPKSHAWSFSHTPPRSIDEMISLKIAASDLLLTHGETGRVLAFEHGAMSFTRRGGCCLDHAHLNVVEIPRNMAVLKMARKHFDFQQLSLNQLRIYAAENRPYLFFWCDLEGTFFADAPVGSSQFFRQLISVSLREKEWDWRSNPNMQTVRNMAKILNAKIRT